MQEEQTVNGIDAAALKDTIQVLRENPDGGQFRFRARSRWVQGGHCVTTIQDFSVSGEEDTTRPMPFILEADEPAVLLGTDFGANATETLLHALASCVRATLIYHAAARDITIDAMHIDLEGNLDLRGILGISEDVRNGFEAIRMTVKVKSDASQEQIDELVQLAQQRSPVFDIVTHETPVSVRAEKMTSQAAKPEMAFI